MFISVICSWTKFYTNLTNLKSFEQNSLKFDEILTFISAYNHRILLIIRQFNQI